MPIIATTNLKEKNIYNKMKFKIRSIKGDGKPIFLINGQEFTEEEFSKLFIPSFCLTVCKYQGGEIYTHYNISDVNRMDKKFYSALSRTTKFEYIHLNKTMLLKSYQNRKLPELELINAKHNSLFKNGKIYEVSFDNDMIYVGSTCEEL